MKVICINNKPIIKNNPYNDSLKNLVEGKSILSTVATHTPRNSYLGCADSWLGK